MSHNPIIISSLGLSFPHKTCFSRFSTQIIAGSRIGIIGRNGAGKSCLLQMLAGHGTPAEGDILMPLHLVSGYVPQIIDEGTPLSGGQRLMAALAAALALHPDVLLLDEPTNHLSRSSRHALLRKLMLFRGTLLVVSHDIEILRSCVNTLWHIEDAKVTVFRGTYDDYQQEIRQKCGALEENLRFLKRQQKEAHQVLMKEQERAKKSSLRGEKKRLQGHWPTMVAGAKKQQGQETAGRKKHDIALKKQNLLEQLSDLRAPEVIIPRFRLNSAVASSRVILSIREGAIGYEFHTPIVQNITLSLAAGERLAITGENGCGKSTLIKAVLNDVTVIKSGDWLVPRREDIGYLDQHYLNLDPAKAVIDSLSLPTLAETRQHLNDFLFRKNEEVYARVATLSGGEKARLSLAQIAANPPRLLILDEMTNNLDLETRTHVIQVLKDYPGAIIVISHEEDFLEAISIDTLYEIRKDI